MMPSTLAAMTMREHSALGRVLLEPKWLKTYGGRMDL
jgi:hypothetical protein